MLLAIDVGNTNTVFALHNGAGMVAEWRCQTNGQRTSDEYFVWLHMLMQRQKISPPDVDAAIIATVVPQTLFNLRRMCREYFDCDPMVVGAENVTLGIDVRVKREREVGADRLVNTVAAYQTYGPNLVVVDFGTATTFDVVAADGAYVGGLIVPGINLSLAALHQAAAKLPNVDVARPQKVVGDDTVSAMQSGVYWGYVAMIEGLCARIAAERDRAMTVIATGGLSPLFATGTEVIQHVDQDLTMRGLVHIHRLNTGTSE